MPGNIKIRIYAFKKLRFKKKINSIYELKYNPLKIIENYRLLLKKKCISGALFC